MSAWFKLQLTIDCSEAKKNDVIDAAQSLWDFSDVQKSDMSVNGIGRVYMSGEDKSSHSNFDTLLQDIVRAVWKANGEYCEVDAQSLYLEEPPWEEHPFDEEDYDDFIKESS